MPAPAAKGGTLADASFSQSPLPGDIIIERTGDRSKRYTLGTLEQRAQVTCTTRDHAVEQGTKYATVQSVRVWLLEDRATFKLIADYPINTKP